MAGCAASLDDMGPEYDEFADDMAARDEHWENLAPYAVVLGLRLRLTVPVVPAVLQEFKHLQYLSLEFPDFTGAMQPMDLAVFWRIPNFRLQVRGSMDAMYGDVGRAGCGKFCLTAGTWETFEVQGLAGLSIEFTDVDAFVQGTKQWSFILSDEDLRAPRSTYTALQQACARQGVQCYGYSWEMSIHLDGDELGLARLSTRAMGPEAEDDPYLALCNGKVFHNEVTSMLWPSDPITAVAGKPAGWGYTSDLSEDLNLPG